MSKVTIENSIALVSGANRGIGKAITEELLNKGAKKVYAGARNPESLSELKEKYGDRLVPVQLDVTNQESVDKVASEAKDVNVLINNAGVLVSGDYRSNNMMETLDQNFAVNVYGVARLTQAFLPSIQQNEGSAIATVSSVVGLGNMPMANSYSASKAAVHSMIQGLRAEVKESNVLVSGIYPGPIETDMTKQYEDIEKSTPEALAKNVVEGLEQGEEDIFPDVMAAQVKQAYFSAPKEVEKMFSAWA